MNKMILSYNDMVADQLIQLFMLPLFRIHFFNPVKGKQWNLMWKQKGRCYYYYFFNFFQIYASPFSFSEVPWDAYLYELQWPAYHSLWLLVDIWKQRRLQNEKRKKLEDFPAHSLPAVGWQWWHFFTQGSRSYWEALFYSYSFTHL